MDKDTEVYDQSLGSKNGPTNPSGTNLWESDKTC